MHSPMMLPPAAHSNGAGYPVKKRFVHHARRVNGTIDLSRDVVEVSRGSPSRYGILPTYSL